jgi:hypothetical protein
MKNILFYLISLIILGSYPLQASNVRSPTPLLEKLKEEDLRSLRKFHQLQRSIMGQLIPEERINLIGKLRQRDRAEVREKVEVYINLTSEEKEALLLQGKKQLLLVLQSIIDGKKELINSEDFYQIMSQLPPPPPREQRPL